MKAVLLTEKQRRQIIKTVRPSQDDFFSWQNLNLLTGVTDEESGAVLTKTYNLNEAIRRTGDAYDDVTFILLIKGFAAQIYTYEYHYGEHFRSISSPLPLWVSSEKVKELITFYENSYFERSQLAKAEMMRQHKDPGKRHSFTEDYLMRNVFNSKGFSFEDFGETNISEDTGAKNDSKDFRETNYPDPGTGSRKTNDPEHGTDFGKMIDPAHMTAFKESTTAESVSAPRITLGRNMKYQIVYGSRYGSTERYAKRLSELTGIPASSYEELSSVGDCNVVIHLGGLYAGGVKGLKTTLKTLKSNAKLIIVTVGLADVTDQENITNIRNSLAKQVPAELLADAEIFHLRGAIDYSKLGLKHKTMMALLYQKAKKLPEDQQTAEIRAMIETYNKKVDFVDFDMLEPVVRAIDEVVKR